MADLEGKRFRSLENGDGIVQMVISTLFKNSCLRKFFARLSNVWFCAHIICINLCFCHYIHFFFLYFSMEWDNVLCCVEMLIFILQHNYLIYRRKQLKSLLASALLATNHKPSKASLKYKKFLKFSYLLVFLFIMPLSTFWGGFYAATKGWERLSAKEWAESFTCGYPIENHGLRRFLTALDVALYVYIITGATMLVPLFLCFTISCLADRMEEISKDLRALRPPLVTASRILAFRNKFKDLQTLLTSIDDIFSSVFLLYYGSSLICCCHGVYFFFRDLLLGVSRDFFLVLVSFGSVVGGFVMCIFGSHLQGQTQRNYEIARDLSCGDAGKLLDRSAYDELHLFILQLTSPPQGVTVGKCFILSKNFILSFFGVICTYMIIIAQNIPVNVIHRENTSKF